MRSSCTRSQSRSTGLKALNPVTWSKHRPAFGAPSSNQKPEGHIDRREYQSQLSGQQRSCPPSAAHHIGTQPGWQPSVPEVLASQAPCPGYAATGHLRLTLGVRRTRADRDRHGSNKSVLHVDCQTPLTPQQLCFVPCADFPPPAGTLPHRRLMVASCDANACNSGGRFRRHSLPDAPIVTATDALSRSQTAPASMLAYDLRGSMRAAAALQVSHKALDAL